MERPNPPEFPKFPLTLFALLQQLLELLCPGSGAVPLGLGLGQAPALSVQLPPELLLQERTRKGPGKGWEKVGKGSGRAFLGHQGQGFGAHPLPLRILQLPQEFPQHLGVGVGIRERTGTAQTLRACAGTDGVALGHCEGSEHWGTPGGRAWRNGGSPGMQGMRYWNMGDPWDEGDGAKGAPGIPVMEYWGLGDPGMQGM